ncbi:acetyl-CoA hydrolase, partial [Candidatus Poribacteria bacterium]|nr:acetyl-CoA hydrolase [Candidatus Poribacteria bacterium]
MRDGYPRLTAEEAAAHVTNGMTVVTSGFTSAGAIKAVGPALALRAEEFHRQGKPFKVKLLTGASTGDKLDGVLARADALSLRAPYQSDPLERRMINQGQIPFFDMHLSHIPQYTDYGFFGQLDVAVVEATSISPEGHVYLTASGGCTPTWLKKAKRVIIEVNRYHSPRLREMYDIYDTPPPPRRREVPIYHPLDKIGTPFAYVDPSKVIGIVETNEPDEQTSFRAYDEVCAAIGGHVVDFLVSEQKAGRIPFEMLPLQAGVGN